MPQAQFQRRSFNEDTSLENEYENEQEQSSTTQSILDKYRNFRTRSQRPPYTKANTTKIINENVGDKVNHTINDKSKVTPDDYDNNDVSMNDDNINYLDTVQLDL